MGKRRSAGIEEVREKSELRSCASPTPNKLIIDYSRKMHQGSRFDDECRRIHMFAEQKLISEEGIKVESRPFSYALEVLNSDKGLFMEFWSEPDSQCIKNSQTKKHSVNSVHDDEFSKCESQDKRAELQNRKSFGNFTTHSSSRQSRERSSSSGWNGRRASFSIGELKKKLKHTFAGTTKEAKQFSKCGTSSKLSHKRSIFGDDCIYCGVDAMNPLSSSTNLRTKEKQGKLERKPDLGWWESDTVRKKIDFSSGRFSKHGVNAVLEANRFLSETLIDSMTRERSPRTLEMIISSLEHDYWTNSQRRDDQYCYGSEQRFSHTPNEGGQRTCLSPLRISTSYDDGYKDYDDRTVLLSTWKRSSVILSTDEEAQDHTMSGNTKSNDEPKIVGTNDDVLHSKVPNDGNAKHSTLASVSDNETFTNTADDFPSTLPSVNHFNMTESSKYLQDEHESPVSVLDQLFTEDINNPPSIMFQSDGDPLEPGRLCFEEYSSDSSYQDEQDYIAQYVHLVLRASSLNWDQISKIRPLSQELLHSSLHDEVEFQFSDFRFDTRLLFDRMNEVLLEIQRSHFLSANVKRRIRSAPLEEVLLNEIMREAEFYLLPRTQKRTLDQLVARDDADCRLWLDLLLETEHIMIHISEIILEESIVDLLLEIH